MEVRLQKFLANAGVASRRNCEKLILSGYVTVNNKIITELGTKIDEKKDIVKYKGKRINLTEKNIYIMLHKPKNYITTTNDQFNRPTVLDLLPNFNERIFPVGRLDYDTSGLIILTNDGGLTYKLTHPKNNIDKTYVARIKGELTVNELNKLKRGIIIENYKTSPAKVKVLSQNKGYSDVEIIIHEGKNRQVRNMFDAVGHGVTELKRISLGNLNLESLTYGKFRVLNEQEIKYLQNL